MSSERGGMCFHESGRLVDSIGLRADIARLCRWRGFYVGNPYVSGVRQRCGLMKDTLEPRGAHWPRKKRHGHRFGFDLAQRKVMPVSTEWGDFVLDPRKVKMGVGYELLPRQACLEEWGVSCLRIGMGTRVSPKVVESHQRKEEGWVSLTRKSIWLTSPRKNRLASPGRGFG